MLVVLSIEAEHLLLLLNATEHVVLHEDGLLHAALCCYVLAHLQRKETEAWAIFGDLLEVSRLVVDGNSSFLLMDIGGLCDLFPDNELLDK